MDTSQPLITDDSLSTSQTDSLANQITELAGHINAANYRFLKLIAEFDREGGWSGAGIKSCAHWLNWQCGIALNAAREKLRAAHSLEELPLIDQAFATGALSYSKVRAMTRVATADNEGYLLMIAEHGTASHMDKLVRQFQSVKRQQQEEQAETQYEGREVVYYQDDEGMWVIHAKLPPEAGALVIKALEAAKETEQDNGGGEQSPSPTNDAPSDEAKTVNENTEENDAPAEACFAKESNEQIASQKRADALLTLAEHFIATSISGAQRLSGPNRYQLVLHVTPESLKSSSENVNVHNDHELHRENGCHLEDGPWLPPETARRLGCDASMLTVLENNAGEILNIGRRSRTVPSAMRRALTMRDCGCRFPGCCESRHVDAHHIHHWADGGETSLDNLVLLCEHHHRLLHQGTYHLYCDESSQIVFTDCKGQILPESVFPQFPAQEDVSKLDGVEPGQLTVVKEQRALEINSSSSVSAWDGGSMDMGMAVDRLMGSNAGKETWMRGCSH